VPVLTPAPRQHLARQSLALARDQEALRKRKDRALASANAAPELAAELKRQAAALHENERLLGLLRSRLTPSVGTEDLLDAAHLIGSMAPGPDYGASVDGVLQYLRRDWGREPQSEREVRALSTAARDALRAAKLRSRPVVVLGAGVGRVSHMLAADHADVIAIEHSVAMTLAHELLLEGPLTFNVVRRDNLRFGSAPVTSVTCRSVAQPRSLSWLIADACACPLASGSAGAVVSCYFSDVVRPSLWVPEVSRILAKGGVFVHVGPLGFHFEEAHEKRSADQFVELLGYHGLRVRRRSSVRSTHLVDPDLCVRMLIENLVVVAEKVSEPIAHRVGVSSVLRFAPGTKVVMTQSITNSSRQTEKCIVQARDGRSCELSEFGPALLEVIDGRKTFDEIRTDIAEQIGAGALSTEHLGLVTEDVQRLLAAGAIRARRGRKAPSQGIRTT
jgi:carnosine N-methyltransferase